MEVDPYPTFSLMSVWKTENSVELFSNQPVPIPVPAVKKEETIPKAEDPIESKYAEYENNESDFSYMLTDPPDYLHTLGNFYYDTSDEDENEDKTSGVDGQNETKDPDDAKVEKAPDTSKEEKQPATAEKRSEEPSADASTASGVIQNPASTSEKLLRLSESNTRILFPSASATNFLFVDPKIRALEEKIDRDVFESLERFFVPYPWSVVPKFFSLLIRSLNLDYTAVFCTADFVRRVRRVSIALIRHDPIRTTPSTISELTAHPTIDTNNQQIISTYLKQNVLNLISACCLGVSWCIEKAAMIVRAKARIGLYEIFLNDVSTTHFVTLCKYIFNDARINARRKFSPPNVLQFEEIEKQNCIQYFVDLNGSLPRNNISQELSVFAVNKPNARRVAAFSDKEKTIALLESLKTRGVDFERLYHRNPEEIGRVFEAAIDIFPMDPTIGAAHYTDPMYGYFIRLVDEATSRGLGYETDAYDIALEEIHPINYLAMGFLETYINDRLGPAANCMRIALFDVASTTGRQTQAWNQLLQWCIQDRDRLVQFVELVALHRSMDRVIDRSSAALEPVVARRMETSMQAILAWFREINTSPSK